MLIKTLKCTILKKITCKDFTNINTGINKLIHHDLFDHLQNSQTIYS